MDVRIIEYTGMDKTTIVIPTTVNKKKVVEIKGFDDIKLGVTLGIFRQERTETNTTITSIDMFNASHLLKIDYYAFYYMNVLGNVILPEGLTTIENTAFAYTKGLKSITIPASVKTIGTNVFFESALASITLSEGLETIDDSAFKKSSLTSITIPASVKTIKTDAFRDNTALAIIILSEGLEKIEGTSSFANTAITSIVLPSTLQSIGGFAFNGNTNLTSVTILRNAIGEANPLTTAGANIFLGTPIAAVANKETTKIYYPTGTAYKTTNGWKDYATSTTWIEGMP